MRLCGNINTSYHSFLQFECWLHTQQIGSGETCWVWWWSSPPCPPLWCAASSGGPTLYSCRRLGNVVFTPSDASCAAWPMTRGTRMWASQTRSLLLSPQILTGLPIILSGEFLLLDIMQIRHVDDVWRCMEPSIHLASLRLLTCFF